MSGRWRKVRFQDWYDWAVVWRYWNRQGAGLRLPSPREARELLRLADAAELSLPELAERTGLTYDTILRWNLKFSDQQAGV